METIRRLYRGTGLIIVKWSLEDLLQLYNHGLNFITIFVSDICCTIHSTLI